MIIKISKHGIYAMAENIAVMYKQMDSVSLQIHEHIGKCIIWGASYKDFDHWVSDEIASWIDRIARKKPKSKLKPGAVKDHLFNVVGDEYVDAYLDLLSIYEDSQRKVPPYPEKEITQELGDRFFHAYREIESYFSKYIATHKFDRPAGSSYKDEIVTVLYSILDRYC